MSLANLVTVFGPNLLRASAVQDRISCDMTEMMLQHKTIAETLTKILQNVDVLFDRMVRIYSVIMVYYNFPYHVDGLGVHGRVGMFGRLGADDSAGCHILRETT